MRECDSVPLVSSVDLYYLVSVCTSGYHFSSPISSCRRYRQRIKVITWRKLGHSDWTACKWLSHAIFMSHPRVAELDDRTCDDRLTMIELSVSLSLSLSLSRERERERERENLCPTFKNITRFSVSRIILMLIIPKRRYRIREWGKKIPKNELYLEIDL
jgi:hypothetical protein